MSALLDDDRAYVETLAEIKPRPIHDDAENERQTVLLEYLSFLENPTEEQRTIAEMLTILIEAYEKQFTLPKASPLEVLRELMAAHGIEQKDLTPGIASKGYISDILSGKRPISQGMAQKLAERFNVDRTLFL